jgi:GNAT superfamily N-acetyltransferase
MPDALQISSRQMPGQSIFLTPSFKACAPLRSGQWSPNLASVFEREIATRVERGRGRIAQNDSSHPVLVAEQDGRLLGLALVSFFPAAPVPYGILEDIVVDDRDRNSGLGKRILDWITEEAKMIGCVRLFLESGLGNEAAHHFFEREGFKTVFRRNDEATPTSQLSCPENDPLASFLLRCSM